MSVTLASHSMPAREMPSSTVTVTTPMMRMSLVGSTMRELCSWGGGTIHSAGRTLPLSEPQRSLWLLAAGRWLLAAPCLTPTMTIHAACAGKEEVEGTGPSGLTEPLPYLQQVPDGFGKAHGVHGHGHRVRKGEDQPNGAAQLRPEAPRDEEVGAP